MELTSDFPFWSICNGLPSNYPALREDLTCEAVVVGGGITGAMAAYHLIQAGINTVVVDKRDIGTGSTSGSTALLQYEVDVPLRDLIERVGKAGAWRAYQLCYEAIDRIGRLATGLRIDCDFEPKPSLFLGRTKDEIPELEKECRLRREAGIEVDFWTAADIEQRFSFSRPAALFSKRAAQLDPHRFTHGLLKAGCRRGLLVFDRSAVQHFKPERKGIVLELENGVTIKARRAVIAAGFESMAYLRGEAGGLKSTYALISEPMDKIQDWYRRCLIWESGMPYLYLRTTADNRIIVGGEDVNIVNAARRDALIKAKTRVLARKFHKLFPAMELEVAYSWAGTFGGTKDGLPYIGANPALPHAYFALGYGGNGITFSLIAAEMIRDDFLGRRNPDAHLFKFGR